MSKMLSMTAALAAVGALLVTSASDAEAAFKLRLTELGADRVVGGTGADVDTIVTIQDNGADDENATVGIIKYSQNIGNFMFNLNVGFSKTALGTPTSPQLHLTNVQLTTGVLGGTILIDLTDTGFSSADSYIPFITEFGGAGSGALSLQTFVSLDDQEFSKTGTQVANFGGFGPDQGGHAPVDGAYSISLFSSVSMDPSSSTSFDVFVKVPEPRTLALFGIGLLGLGFLARASVGARIRRLNVT